MEIVHLADMQLRFVPSFRWSTDLSFSSMFIRLMASGLNDAL